MSRGAARVVVNTGGMVHSRAMNASTQTADAQTWTSPPTREVLRLLREKRDAGWDDLVQTYGKTFTYQGMLATCDPGDEVRAGRFREDLLFRINTIELQLPALRERREDIPSLAMHFLRRHAARYRKQLAGFDAGAMKDDIVRQARWFFEGGCLCRTTSGLNGLLVSRPTLESAIREASGKLQKEVFVERRAILRCQQSRDSFGGNL